MADYYLPSQGPLMHTQSQSQHMVCVGGMEWGEVQKYFLSCDACHLHSLS